MTESMREAFEKWASNKLELGRHIDGVTGFGDRLYGSYQTHVAWEAWKAAYAAGQAAERERAARACEEWAEQHRIAANEKLSESCDFRVAAEDCAAAIRGGTEV